MVSYRKILMKMKKGKKEAYRVARQKDRVSKDTQPVWVIKDAEGNTHVESEDILRGWKGYFKELMNGSNEKAS